MAYETTIQTGEEIVLQLSAHDNSYDYADWFVHGTFDKVEDAADKQTALTILAAAYKGVDVDGVAVSWS